MNNYKRFAVYSFIVASIFILGCSNNNSLKSREDSNLKEEIQSKKTENNELVKENDTLKSDEVTKDNEVINDDKSTKDTGIYKNTEETKQVYINKLNELDNKLKISLKEKYDSPKTNDMTEAASEEFSQWDNMLNEIYSLLEQQLPEEEMDKLRNEELNWINTKEKKAKEEEAKYEGGTIAPLMRLTSLIGSTKNRCYELVNQYMK